MSAFYSFVYPGHVHLLTDAAFVDECGTLKKIACKVSSSRIRPFAITGRGTADIVFGIIEDLGTTLGNSPDLSVDQMIEMTASFFEELASQKGPINAEFLIAAFSETRGPVHFIVQCHGLWNVDPFKLLSPGAQIGGGPAITLDDIRYVGLTDEIVMADDFPERCGPWIMDAMRRKPGQVPGTESMLYAIGGECHLTTVTAAGVTTRTLCYWNDELDTVIDPTSKAKFTLPVGINI